MRNLLIFFVVLIVLVAAFVVPSYNRIASLDEGVGASWAQVQNQYKRRADLIPNLVSAVKGYAAHESQTLQNVIEARSKVSAININSPQDVAALKEFNDAQQGLSSALSRLMMISESYPNLKADQNFLSLQSQLEGSENRISVARRDYIAAVREFNLSLRQFPSSLVARIFYPTLSVKPTFEASASEQNAPVVDFSK